MKKAISRVLAVILNFTLVGSSFADIPGLAAAPKGPDFVQPFTPPTSLGYVTNFYKGKTEKPVILIQDLHANYGVQKKIIAMLEFLQPKVTEGGKSMVIGMEGAWGNIDLSSIKARPEAVRRKAGDYLLKNAEVTAATQFTVMSEKPVTLIGVDDPDSYKVHRELFKSSLVARLSLAHKIEQLRKAVRMAKGEAPRSLTRLWKLESRFRQGNISLEQLSKELNRSLTNYGQAEAALEEAKMAIASSQKDAEKAFFLKNLVAMDQNLDLLLRLFRQQLTMEEVQMASKRVPEMLVGVQILLPGENMKLWKDTVQSAIDHYAVAYMRNTPMAENAARLAQSHPQTAAIIIAGGFHTAGIMDSLQKKGISYIAVAPIVESHTSEDERTYLLRMMDIHVGSQEIASAMQSGVLRNTVVQSEGYTEVARQTGSPQAVVVEGVLDGTVPAPQPLSREALEAQRVIDQSAADTVASEKSGPTPRTGEKIAAGLGTVIGKPNEIPVDVNPEPQTAAGLGGGQGGVDLGDAGRDRDPQTDQKKKNSITPYVLGAIGLVAVLGAVAYAGSAAGHVPYDQVASAAGDSSPFAAAMAVIPGTAANKAKKAAQAAWSGIQAGAAA